MSKQRAGCLPALRERPAVWPLAAALIALTAPAASARPTFTAEVGQEISLAQRLESPSFLAARQLKLMDRGKLLYLGQGTNQEEGQFHLLRLADGTVIKPRAPLPPWSDSRAAARRVLDLLFYDSEQGQAGFHVRLRGPKGFEQRYLHWDLQQNRVVRVERFVDRYAAVRPIGFSPQSGLLYCQVERSPASKRKQPPLELVALGAQPARRIARISTKNAVSRGPFFDARHARALVVEYAERGIKSPAPSGYLVDLESGEVLRLSIPFTTYGAAFSGDGQTIYLYSAQEGALWAVDSARGQRRRERRVGGQGHALGMPFAASADETLLLVRSSGLLFLEPPRLRWLAQLPIGRLFSGFSHVAGSLVGPGHAFVRNGSTLHVVRLRKQP